MKHTDSFCLRSAPDRSEERTGQGIREAGQKPAPEIRRIDSYADPRFSQRVLNQHGAYLVDGAPCEIEILEPDMAEVRGEKPAFFPELMELFRFHAPQITRFVDQRGGLLAEYPPVERFPVALSQIQPSQFFVDAEKLRAVESFVSQAQDIVIQVLRWQDRFISLDGHTRLYLAAERGYDTVLAVEEAAEDWVWRFVAEARKRRVYSPKDMKLLSHQAYEREWNQYCDSVFNTI